MVPDRVRAAHLIAAGVVAVATAVVYAFDPATSRLFPPCALHTLTGLQCPGCGGTRAVHQLLHGNIRAAFALNPMVFVLIAVAPIVALRPAIASRPWFAWTAAAALIAWGVLRNVM
ncbi:MAG TPA: DUF2752 domain-containing protein [Thermoanaerobaculia bacterium]